MYQEQQFSLLVLAGFSERQVNEHLKLYAGYVKNTNLLLEKIQELSLDPIVNSALIAECKRRLGFEFNGMRLHEYYFSQLGGTGDPTGADALYKALGEQYGSFDAWKAECERTALMRGIGWVLLTHDTHGGFHTSWVSDHELGHLAGLPIILALDVWEHAYLLDYLPSQRKEYVAAFFANLKWEVLQDRFIKAVNS
ncbi:MAG: hypothetical protein A2542_01660 [Parcubacteria group bacterium RIFOXYD2_FULL_52_8]|nr:MAG: hypothetical protein A2542_01660 [Parcubacteria group bacterium RIFOXYD2_FULL_52_8]